VAVTLLEYLPGIIPLEDKDASAALERSFTRRGIKVMTKARFDAASVKVSDGGVTLMVGPEGSPAAELKVLVFDPNYQPSPKRVARVRPPTEVEPKPAVASTNSAANKPKFTKQQVTGRLRQLKLLFEEGLLTDDFYDGKVAECEAAR